MTQPSHDNDARLLAALSQLMHDSDGADDTVTTVFDQAQLLLPVAADASITIRERAGKFTSFGSSSQLAADADGLQYELNEGPCLDAASPNGEGWFRSADLATDTRWGTWAPRAAELGAGSLLSIQLLNDERPFGAINLYARDTGQFDEREEIDRALVWASHAATALSAVRVESQLHTAISARHMIGVAQGILMERFDIDQATSFKFLTRLASQMERRVASVAADIIRTRQVPAP